MIQSGNSFMSFPIIFEPNIKYGYLYNWFAASHADFAPVGWHVPTDAEWTVLTDYLGGLSVSGGKLKEAGFAHWSTPNTGADNSSGFTALPGGYRNFDGSFNFIGYSGIWWSSTEVDATFAWYRSLLYGTSNTARNNYNNPSGFSILLLKDNSINPGILTDYDNNVYGTVKIGNQVWLTNNWACTRLNNGTPLTKVTNDTAWAALTTEGYCAYNNDENNVFI